MDHVSLSQLGADLLAQAREAASQRAAHTIFGGQEHARRQTLIALAGGAGLAEHDSPGEATLQVVAGRIRFRTDDDSLESAAGDLLTIPLQRHAVAALEDSVLLLTVWKEPA